MLGFAHGRRVSDPHLIEIYSTVRKLSRFMRRYSCDMKESDIDTTLLQPQIQSRRVNTSTTVPPTRLTYAPYFSPNLPSLSHVTCNQLLFPKDHGKCSPYQIGSRTLSQSDATYESEGTQNPENNAVFLRKYSGEERLRS